MQVEQCDQTSSGTQCAFVKGHRGDHRFPFPGEGDLSPEIRLRVALDRALDQVEELGAERLRVQGGGIDPTRRWLAVARAWEHVESLGYHFGAGPHSAIRQTYRGLPAILIWDGTEQACAEVVESRGVWRPNCQGPWLDGYGAVVDASTIAPANGWDSSAPDWAPIEDPFDLARAGRDARLWLAMAEPGELPDGLVLWLRVRMRAYIQGAYVMECGWDRESMAEWIAADLDVDDDEAARLCERAGWPHQPDRVVAGVDMGVGPDRTVETTVRVEADGRITVVNDPVDADRIVVTDDH